MSKNLKAKDYRKAIRAASGVLALAARKLGVSRQAVYDACERYVTVQETLDEERATVVDEAEGRLIKAMKNDREWAIKMILRTQGGERFQETQKHEHTGKDGGPMQTQDVPLSDAALARIASEDGEDS